MINNVDDLINEMNVCKQYKEKTGRNHGLLITNVSPQHLFIYEAAVLKFPEIEILDIAYTASGDLLENYKAVVFKDKYNYHSLQDFWRECDNIKSKQI